MNKIETTIEINASPEKVWATFSDFTSYPKWSSFIEKIEGNLEIGMRLEVLLKPPGKDKGTTFKPKVVKVESNKEFRWLGKLGGVGFLFVGEHYFVFETAGNGTRVTHGEKFKGLLVPLMGKVLASTKIGFENFNKALKSRVESRQNRF